MWENVIVIALIVIALFLIILRIINWKRLKKIDAFKASIIIKEGNIQNEIVNGDKK